MKSVHLIEPKYLRKDVLDDRSQGLHSLIALNEHPPQLSDGLFFLLCMLFALVLSCRDRPVCSGGLRCVLRAGRCFEDGPGPCSSIGGAWDSIVVFRVRHRWVTIHHTWRLRAILETSVCLHSFFWFYVIVLSHLQTKIRIANDFKMKSYQVRGDLLVFLLLAITRGSLGDAIAVCLPWCLPRLVFVH